jgi:hypothetical protein
LFDCRVAEAIGEELACIEDNFGALNAEMKEFYSSPVYAARLRIHTDGLYHPVM